MKNTYMNQYITRAAKLENLNWHTVNDIFLKGREKKETRKEQRTKSS